MTNEQKIRNELLTIEGLADYLVRYDDYYGEYRTSDGETFEHKYDATKHEIKWLKEKFDET